MDTSAARTSRPLSASPRLSGVLPQRFRYTCVERLALLDERGPVGGVDPVQALLVIQARVESLGQQVSELFLDSSFWVGVRIVLALLRLAYLDDLAAGRLVGEEEPVFVVNVREEGKIAAVAPHAHPAGARELTLLTAAETVSVTGDGVVRELLRDEDADAVVAEPGRERIHILPGDAVDVVVQEHESLPAEHAREHQP